MHFILLLFLSNLYTQHEAQTHDQESQLYQLNQPGAPGVTLYP